MVFDRVLRGDNQEWLRQRIRVRVHGDLAFVHGFEQGGLRFGRGAIDFIGQQHVGKDWATLEFELLLDGGVNRNPQHVRREHVAGELHSLKSAVERPRQSLSQSSFADAGNAFDEQVSASNQGDDGQTENVILASNHFAEGVFQLRRTMRNGTGSFRGHCLEFYYAAGRIQSYGGYEEACQHSAFSSTAPSSPLTDRWDAEC